MHLNLNSKLYTAFMTKRAKYAIGRIRIRFKKSLWILKSINGYGVGTSTVRGLLFQRYRDI